jgi:hypothetical protein
MGYSMSNANTGRKRLGIRYSLSRPCRGAFDDEDIAAITADGLADLVNGRVRDGIVISRGGQSARCEAMDGAVYGVIDTSGGEFDDIFFQSVYPGIYILVLSFYPPGSTPSVKYNVARFYGAGLSHSNHWRQDGVGYHPDGPITRSAPGLEYQTTQPFRDNLAVVAWQGGAPYLWEAVLGLNGDVWFNRLVEIDYATVGEVISLCVREEAGEEILYCGTTLGRVLRWDGSALTVVHTMSIEFDTRVACIGGSALFAAGGNGGLASPAPCAYQLSVGGAWVDIASPYSGLGHYNGFGPEYVNALSEFEGVCVISGSTGTSIPNLSGGDWLWDPASPSVLSVAWGNAQASHPPPAVDWRVSSSNDSRIQRGSGVVVGGKYFASVRHPHSDLGYETCSLLVANSLNPTDFSFLAVPMASGVRGPSLISLNGKVVYLATGFPAQNGAGGLEGNYGLIMVDPTNLNPVWYFPIDEGEFWGFDIGQFNSNESYLIPDPTLPDPTEDPDIPVASFSMAPSSGARPLLVNFTDTSTSGGEPITSWEWIFTPPIGGGSGGQSNLQNPSYTFNTTAGVATVRLKVSNSKGSSFCTKFIVVT